MEYNCFDWQPSTLSAAVRIMTEALGSAVTLGEAKALWDAPDNCKRNVLRCEMTADDDAAPKTIILKRIASPRITYCPADMSPDTISWRHGTEWAACRMLGAVDPDRRRFPRCYGGDRDEALLVLEDLGDGPTVASTLMGEDPSIAERALLGYAQTLGRMHAATCGREEKYNRIRTELKLPTVTAREDDVANVRRHDNNFRKLIGGYGHALSPAVDSEMEGVLHCLAEPGPFLVLTHGDPNPVNDLQNGGIVRLYDFEYGGFRHALMDGVFNRHLYHWVRCSLPDSVLARFEACYRRELARACPEAENEDQYRLEQMRARSVWMVVTLNSLLERAAAQDGYEEERSGFDGIIAPSLRQRALILLERFAADAEKYRCLPAMGKLARDLGSNLKTRWRIEPIEIALYPAFRRILSIRIRKPRL